MKDPKKIFASILLTALLVVVFFALLKTADEVQVLSKAVPSDTLEKPWLIQNPLFDLNAALYGKPLPHPLSLGHACLSKYTQHLLPNTIFTLLSKTPLGTMVPLTFLYHLVNIHAP